MPPLDVGAARRSRAERFGNQSVMDAASAETHGRYSQRGAAMATAIHLGRECEPPSISAQAARNNPHLRDGLYYRIISELTCFDIPDDKSLVAQLCSLAEVKSKYDKVEGALHDANTTGYGIVTPDIDDLRLEEPEIVHQPGGYGVRLRAAAPSIHMIKAEIETELNPIVGSEQQSEELIIPHARVRGGMRKYGTRISSARRCNELHRGCTLSCPHMRRTRG